MASMTRKRGWISSPVRIAMAMVCAVVAASPLARAGFIPGGGAQRSDCYAQLYVADVDSPGPQVKGAHVVTCTDGDPCDFDTRFASPGGCGNDSCSFKVAVCVGQTNPDLPACTPAPLRQIFREVRHSGTLGQDSGLDRTQTSILATSLPREWRSGPSCGQPSLFDVRGRVTKDGRKLPGRLKIAVDAVAVPGTHPARDRDTIILECLPRTTPCPDDPPPTTTTTLPDLTTNPTVLVGAGGGIRFDPDTVRIHAGDTVRWVWVGSGYDLASYRGASGVDGAFCYPGCEEHPAVGRVVSGAVYEHAFPELGTFEYESTWAFPMRGRVVVEP